MNSTSGLHADEICNLKQINLTGLFHFKIMKIGFKIMKIGYVTFENNDNFVSNPKLEQLICDEIFPWV